MKERRDKREKKIKDKQKEAGIVTKESICATFALFSFLALLILCTRSLIFGDFGANIHAALTGVFGYLAYPLFLGALYLFVTALFDKKFVKKRSVGVMVGLALFSLSLIVHIALSFDHFDQAGYISYCFNPGDSFPNTTVAGGIGGLVALGAVKLLSKVGALVIFSLLTIFFGYLVVVFAKKPKKLQEESATDLEQENSSMEIPLVQTQEGNISQTPVVPQQMDGGYIPTVNQRPGVRLTEDSAAKEPSAGFSPFGISNEKEQPVSEDAAYSYANSREFLFGGTPAENYKRNLLFDPNAKVNRRRVEDGSTQTSGYVPSYTNAYQNSVNEQTQPSRPVKIVSDATPNNGYSSYGNGYENNSYDEQSVAHVMPEQSVGEPRFESQTPSYPTYEERTPTSFVNETPIQPTFEREERTEERGESEYRRHEYMDLFSTANPNVFGRDDTPTREEKEDFSTDLFRDNTERENDRATERESVQDGFTLLDDDPFDTRSARDSVEEVPQSFGREQTTERDVFHSDREFERDTEKEVDDETPLCDIVIEPTEIVKLVETEPKVVQPVKKPRVIRPYVRVPLDDFDCRDVEPTSNQYEVEETKENIIATLEDFKVTGATIASVTFGPTVTRYNVALPRSVSPRKVVALDQSIAISLHSSGVNVYPNYEEGVVSIEVPNKERQFVQLGCMLAGDTFVNAKPSSLMFAMGKDVANRKVYGDISKMIHLLVAGSSGSGKSVFLGALIISLIYKYSPEELRLILIDPKKTEFVLYNDLPHLMINEIITDVGKTVQSLNWAIMEMNRRYGLFEQMSRSGTYVVNLDQYNEQLEKKDRLPKIVIIIDELADLMLAAKKEIEDRIQNLTQKARAAGIHLIVATQRPSTDVITGVIKSNLPTRVGFYVATDVDSRVILDQTGAQKLLGKGDFLYTMPGTASPIRLQSAFISPEDSQKVVNFIKNNNEAYYDEEATAFINSRGGYAGDDNGGGASGGEKEVDQMHIEALRHVIISGSASISMIQRKCSAGYNRAGKIVEWMEDMGYISPFDGAKARKVLITKEQFEEKYGPLQ